jgi:hypothetical protein
MNDASQPNPLMISATTGMESAEPTREPLSKILVANARCARFADAEHQAAAEHARDARGRRCQRGEHRPPAYGERQCNACADFIDEPAKRHLHQRVGPEEAAHHKAHLRGADIERLLYLRCGDSEVCTIDIVDRDCQEA